MQRGQLPKVEEKQGAVVRQGRLYKQNIKYFAEGDSKCLLERRKGRGIEEERTVLSGKKKGEKKKEFLQCKPDPRKWESPHFAEHT